MKEFIKIIFFGLILFIFMYSLGISYKFTKLIINEKNVYTIIKEPIDSVKMYEHHTYIIFTKKHKIRLSEYPLKPFYNRPDSTILISDINGNNVAEISSTEIDSFKEYSNTIKNIVFNKK